MEFKMFISKGRMTTSSCVCKVSTQTHVTIWFVNSISGLKCCGTKFYVCSLLLFAIANLQLTIRVFMWSEVANHIRRVSHAETL